MKAYSNDDSDYAPARAMATEIPRSRERDYAQMVIDHFRNTEPLTILNLHGCKMNLDHAVQIAELLSGERSRVRILKFGLRQAETVVLRQLFTAIGTSRKIVELHIIGTHLTQIVVRDGHQVSEVVALVALANAVRSHPTLRVLNLATIGLRGDSIVLLMNGLRGNTTLTGLRFTGNELGDDGATALAEVLPTMTKLSILDVRSCRIGNRGMSALAHAIAALPELTSLNASDNRAGSSGVSRLVTAIVANNRLKSVWVRQSNPTDGTPFEEETDAPFPEMGMTDYDARRLAMLTFRRRLRSKPSPHRIFDDVNDLRSAFEAFSSGRSRVSSQKNFRNTVGLSSALAYYLADAETVRQVSYSMQSRFDASKSVPSHLWERVGVIDFVMMPPPRGLTIRNEEETSQRPIIT